MNLLAVEEQKKIDYVIEIYSQRFLELFNTRPLLDEADRQAVRRLTKEQGIDREKLKLLVTGFFELEDEFLKRSGYKLQFIESRVNAVLAKSGSAHSIRTKYVVALTESGIPVVSYDPLPIGSFKVVTLDEWEKTEKLSKTEVAVCDICKQQVVGSFNHASDGTKTCDACSGIR